MTGIPPVSMLTALMAPYYVIKPVVKVASVAVLTFTLA